MNHCNDFATYWTIKKFLKKILILILETLPLSMSEPDKKREQTIERYMFISKISKLDAFDNIFVVINYSITIRYSSLP